MLRQAQIAKYINLLYEDAFQDWCKKRHDQLLDITRHAVALQRFRAERMPPGATTLETFADFRDQAEPGPNAPSARDTLWTEWGRDYLNQFDEATVLKFLKDPKTSKEVRNLAFARFNPGDFPTHRMLRELMMLDPVGTERDQIMEIATLLLPWCRDGNYGCLFDGTRQAMPAPYCASREAHWVQAAPGRVGLHPRIGQGTEVGGGVPHHQSRPQAHHDAAARDSKAERL